MVGIIILNMFSKATIFHKLHYIHLSYFKEYFFLFREETVAVGGIVIVFKGIMMDW